MHAQLHPFAIFLVIDEALMAIKDQVQLLLGHLGQFNFIVEFVL